MSLRIVFELMRLGVAAEFDNGTTTIEGQVVTSDVAQARLETELAKPRPTYPDLVTAKTAMVKWIDGFLSKITGPVPQYERESWPSKAEAARAVIAGTARVDQTALIAGEAGIQSKTEADIAQKIVAKASRFEAIISQTTGLRVMLEEDLEAEADPLKYEAILEGGKVKAAAMAAALGIEVN
ncbi:hypothetical protein [Ruegeria halocynthiae]|uniref:hypothetical protein n=1 Tax=Ruegeria halocynthiae TaxID=985054 RepID=UPI00056757A9|nr:hypothetical protein [Ruegeria halocynthiae]